MTVERPAGRSMLVRYPAMVDLSSSLAIVTVRSLSFGYRTLSIARPSELSEAQLGYARTTDGEDLTGDESGAWRPSWVVIGSEDECGDPLFVDSADPELPVFTAKHGEGEWQPECVAESLAQFAKVLRFLKPLSHGRESPMEFEQNPLEDVEAVIEKVGEVTACPEACFWSDWLRGNSGAD